MWKLGIEPSSSARAVNTLNHWANFPGPCLSSFYHDLFLITCTCVLGEHARMWVPGSPESRRRCWIRSLAAGVTGDWEPPSMGAGNRTDFLCNSDTDRIPKHAIPDLWVSRVLPITSLCFQHAAACQPPLVHMPAFSDLNSEGMHGLFSSYVSESQGEIYRGLNYPAWKD